ncbi:hypothetical protein BX661DRAFT_191743 [Kickxella alabastrina]|uniref:uncharacterized protein n=1 Tax=Kickxella alabastrina TaxID=61397 RepID=UPI002220DDF0|nr:uncharacterized protein BX661DRAFT_191743 [Kickxella alabastrina]KAI7818369.1 hypothetical protein BX661DRAFT_191743 [Kickxella alabastrina]
MVNLWSTDFIFFIALICLIYVGLNLIMLSIQPLLSVKGLALHKYTYTFIYCLIV